MTRSMPTNACSVYCPGRVCRLNPRSAGKPKKRTTLRLLRAARACQQCREAAALARPEPAGVQSNMHQL